MRKIPQRSFADEPLQFSFSFPLAQCFPLIGVGLALTIGDLHFDQPFMQIEFQRYESAAFGIEPLGKFQDLFFVEQQTAAVSGNQEPSTP